MYAEPTIPMSIFKRIAAALAATITLLVIYDPPEVEVVVQVTDQPDEGEHLLQMPARRPKDRRHKSWPSEHKAHTDLDPEISRQCQKRGWDEVARRRTIERELVQPEGPAFYQQLATPLNAEAADLIDSAVAAEVSLHCLKEHQVPKEEIERACHRHRSSGRPDCSRQRNSKFRTLDGTCNNMQHPFWGSALQPFRRILPAEYEDGISQPHPAFPTGILPPGRQVSICMQNATNQWDETRLSMLFVHFAHFLDHDMNFIAPSKGKGSVTLETSVVFVNLFYLRCQSKRHPMLRVGRKASGMLFVGVEEQ